MTDITVNAYILYSFMAFQSLLLLAVLGALFRLLFVVGRMQGEINGLRGEINGLRGEIDRLWEELRNLRNDLTARIERLEEGVAGLREQVAENRGLLRSLHERVDLVMRHRHHEQTGGVVLTPTEPVPDPAAD